jgi:hypothetical protein
LFLRFIGTQIYRRQKPHLLHHGGGLGVSPKRNNYLKVTTQKKETHLKALQCIKFTFDEFQPTVGYSTTGVGSVNLETRNTQRVHTFCMLGLAIIYSMNSHPIHKKHLHTSHQTYFSLRQTNAISIKLFLIYTLA